MRNGRKQEISERYFFKIQIHYMKKQFHNRYDICRSSSNTVNNIIPFCIVFLWFFLHFKCGVFSAEHWFRTYEMKYSSYLISRNAESIPSMLQPLLIFIFWKMNTFFSYLAHCLQRPPFISMCSWGGTSFHTLLEQQLKTVCSKLPQSIIFSV